MKLKDRLSVLNRQFREIEIPSLDGTSTEIGYYRRPTEIEDQVLKKAMNEEFETILAGLKEGDHSIYQTFVELFTSANRDAAVNTIINSQVDSIREQAVRDLGKSELEVDASEDDRKAYLDELKPHFDERVEKIKEMLEEEPEDILPIRAAQARIESIARDRAFEIYRRRLIAQSLYDKDESSGQFDLVFSSHTEVPEHLDSDTINTITKVIIDEMNRVKNLPLRSAAKT